MAEEEEDLKELIDPKGDETEDEIISEEAEYSPKSDFSKAAIAQIAVQKCMELRSEEMKPGFFNEKETKEGSIIKIWIPDYRLKYIGAVIALQNIMYPEILRDAKTKKFIKEFLDTKGKVFQEYAYVEKKVELSNDNSRYIWKETGRKFIPQIGAAVCVQGLGAMKGEMVRGGWDTFVNAYYDSLVEGYDELFAELNELIYKLNYFKSGISF